MLFDILYIYVEYCITVTGLIGNKSNVTNYMSFDYSVRRQIGKL